MLDQFLDGSGTCKGCGNYVDDHPIRGDNSEILDLLCNQDQQQAEQTENEGYYYCGLCGQDMPLSHFPH
jgi:hypothetical protein